MLTICTAAIILFFSFICQMMQAWYLSSCLFISVVRVFFCFSVQYSNLSCLRSLILRKQSLIIYSIEFDYSYQHISLSSQALSERLRLNTLYPKLIQKSLNFHLIHLKNKTTHQIKYEDKLYYLIQMEDKTFYSLEKVFNRIIETQKLPNQYFQSYSKVWNSFSKWTRAQLEQDRIILVSDYLQFTSQLVPEDNTKEPIVCILQKFLIKNSMQMQDKVDLSFPTIKLNTAAVAKLAELEKQACEIILDNIFEELKKIIAENPKELLIDLSLFGKIKIRDRKIYHYPSQKTKNSGLITNKKTTIRSLLSKDQIPKKLPTLNESAQNLPKLEGSFNDSFSKYQLERPPLQKNKLSGTGEKGEKSGLDHSIVEKLSQKFRINEEGDDYPEMESPTRRYKKHPIALKKEMLGAGLDPLNKDQDFSIMAKTGKNLMAAHFVKPSATKTRYPPIINVFSRTLASPICSSPFPLPLPHRIGSNLSLKCVGLYIHPQKKILMYENTYLHGFETSNEFKQEIASEREEIIYGQMLLNEASQQVKKLSYRDKKELQTKILRKKQVYQRYMNYISNEIESSHIANIKTVWIDSVINNITAYNEIKPYQEEIPDFTILQTDLAESIIHQNLEEVVNDYYRAMKKSITDYVLLDQNQRKRLAIKISFKPVIYWGSQPTKQNIVPYEQREENAKNRQFLTSDLVNCSSVTWSILHSWEIDFKTRCSLLKLPKKGAKRMTIAEFTKQLIDNINQAKNIFLHQFCKVVAQKYDKQIQSFNGNEFYIKKFCQTNATLLSNITRELIYAAIEQYKQFLLSFAAKALRPIKKIIEDQRNDPVHHQFQDAFLIVKMVQRDGRMFYEDTMPSIKQALLRIFDELIKVSHQLSRPQTTLRKSQKQFLPQMTLEDEKYRAAQSQLSPVLNKLLQPLTIVSGQLEVDYKQYIQLRDADFVKSSPNIKKIQEQSVKLEGMVQKLTLLPFYTVGRLIEIDFRDLRKALKARVDDYKDGIIRWAYDGMIKNCQQLFKQIQGSLQMIRAKPESSQKLVQLEKYIMKIEKQLDKKYKSEFQSIKGWFRYLYGIEHPFTQQNYQTLHKTAKLLYSLPVEVTAQQQRIEQERTELEQSVSSMIQQLNTDINNLLNQIGELKKFTQNFEKDEANGKIDQLMGRITNFKETKEIINHDIVTLQMGDEIEFPKLETAGGLIQPYVDLWRMVRSFDNYNNAWVKTPVFKLPLDTIEKQIKQMNSKSIKLINKFNSSTQVNRNQKNKKSPTLEGPLKMLDWLTNQVKDYLKFIPLIRVFSNPGMKERHWTQVSEYTHFPVNPDQNLLIRKLVQIDQIFDKLPELQLIAENAEKEFGIEKIIRKMEDDWQPVNVQLKKWRDTGTFIVAGTSIDQMQQILDDQIVKTQTMKGSPYARIFEAKIKDWQEWLLYTLNFSEYWVKVQSVWLYLQPIFSSPDIKKHLPVEATDFGNVDTQWKAIMSKVVEDTKVINFTKDRSFLQTLKECQNTLDRVQRGLNDYLQGKRAAFPRFYFLSNDELLQILSQTKDPTRVQPHLKKCFEGIQKLKFDQSKKIYGMYSSQNEYVKFLSVVDTNAANGNVDQWLLMVQGVMIESVREVITKAFEDYTNIKRTEWVRNRCGMAVLCISMTFWTYNSEEAIEGGPQTLQKYYNRLNFQLSQIVEITRSDISPLDRCTVEALIVLDVHNRDMINQLKLENVYKISQFAWQSQLRYYWQNSNTWVRMINATLHFNYQYLGNSSRLVITPLTDRCYRTLCGALNLNYGGAPQGPAGTGKTETVKDLAKALARQCVVFNCSDGLDYRAMGKFFKGLASSGAWSCFDQFNRIDLEVLSVVAQQILTITIARKEGKKIFFFEDADIPLKTTCNVFITMNPGYAGRSQLPDNLKALFRAVAMMVPDYTMIAQISLYSFGFNDARNLARKITTTYTLCSEQLSSQDHYDYGMRAVKSVITAAGNLKRKFPNQNESIIMLRAINDVNLAKFLAFDLPLFKGITSDLFPGIVIPEIDYKNMYECIDIKIKEMNLQSTDYFVTKIIQLYEMILVRHGLMVVGLPFSGKTGAIKVLAGALTLLKERNQMNQNKTELLIINPKSISMKQLYGFNDQVSHQWTDGVLAVKFRQFAKSEDPNRKWLIFDGPVDAVWIENMNTVLDDNKKLCLNSGQIIAMSRPMNLIFEPMDLQAASPATVSRCGMVYMQPKSMGWRVLLDSWVAKLPEPLPQQDKAYILSLVDWVADHLLEFIRSSIEESSPTQDQNLVQSLFRLFRSLLKEFESLQFTAAYTDAKVRTAIIEGKFIFSLVWSFGASADTLSRKKIEQQIKKVLSGEIKIDKYQKKKLSYPERNTLFDYNYAMKKTGGPGAGYEWVLWTDYIDLNQKIPKSALPQQIIVKTNDSVRYSQMIKISIENMLPLLFCGPTGTGKSIYIKNFILNELAPQKYMSIELGFSAQTSSMQTQDIIDGKLDKIRKGQYGPKPQNYCVLFVDDLNMPTKEKYGAQPPIQILRQYLDQGGWYEHKDKEKPFKKIINTVLLAAMGPPGGGRSFVTPRILRHLSLTTLTSFEDQTLNRIFSTILKWFFGTFNFNADVLKTEPKIFSSTLEIYKNAMQQFLPTPTKSHYLFNLRDFARVIFGICMSDKQKLQSQEQAVRLWLHEVLRVFSDRLINEEDRLNLFNIAKNTVNRVWQLNFDKVFEHLDKTINGKKDGKVDTLEEIRGLLWTDCMSPIGAKKVYEEVLDSARLQKAVEESLVNYNQTSDKPMDLVLFSFAVEHLLIIARIIKQPTGNACLVGVGGSGRQSLTRLATEISEYSIFQIEITKTYGKTEWKEDLKKILKQSGGKNEPTVFLFTDSQIKDESFVQDVNNLLNTYEVPNLFSNEEKAEIMELVRPVAKNENKAKEGTPAQLYSFFVQKCKKNLHIVLAFSPIGDAFRTRVRMFPSIVNCCTIDWFQEWPQDALLWLARKFLNSIQMQQKIREKCVQMVQYYHSSTSKWAAQFLSKLKRNYYVTPTSYIELITTFKKLLDQKRKEVQADIFKYENGYEKIIQTEKSVEGMKINLIELKPKLKQAAIDTEVKMKEVSENKAAADILKESISGEQKIVKEAVDAANKIKSQCEVDLAEAMPALKAAEDALKVLDKKQIDLLKTMKKPPNIIRVVMKALCLLMYPNPTEKVKNNQTLKMQVDWWAASMKLLANPKLLDELLQFKIESADENIIANLGKYLNDPENVPNLKIEVVQNASTACKCMIMWISGSYNFYHVNKKVKPKKAALAASQAEVKQLSAKLAEKQKNLKAAVDKVTALNSQLESTIRYKERLEKEYDECSKQLERAEQLILSLGGQKDRWGELAGQLKIAYQNLTGDILISAGQIAYLGAFTAAFRSSIIEEWVEQTKKREIPRSQNFSLVNVLGNPVLMRQWNIDGLPSDNFSLENGIIIFKSRRWPLCIDPQGQANKWIKKMQQSKKLNVIKLSDANFIRTLQNSIQFGQPVLLENVGQQLDPALNPILLKQTYQKGNTLYIKLGDQIIEYSTKFIFYITTKYRNPHYLPEISTKVTLLNFMITYEGLNDQLLGIIVKKERPDLQEQKQRLILEGAANQKQLYEIQQQILKVLSSDKNILMDEQAIIILTASKQKATQIKQKQDIATITEKNIDAARQEYKPVSQEASCLFFAISDLGNIDPMYQYSLTYYIQLFTMSIVKSDKSPNLTLRLKNLKNYFLYSLYSNICRSLFEKDKLLLSFLLCTRLAQFKKEITNDGLRFLLTGGVAISDYLPEKPKKGNWISQKSWGEIYRLSQMERFDQIMNSIMQHPDDWRRIYDSKQPQNQKMPTQIDATFTQFEKLMILRTIRPDKMIPAVQNYVVAQLGEKFITPPPFDLAKIYSDSNSVSPLIFILSPGSDPFASLSSFAQSKKKMIKPISLGQGQGPVAEKMIQEGQKTGDWVVLQNCHLAVTWMPILERICEQLSPDPDVTKPDFRLWLTSYPSDKFPTAILQNGVKMTNQPPKGLKANLTGSYLTDPISSEQFFQGNKNQPQNFKVLVFALTFFHAVIQERRKYGPLGWNIPYEFNESDLRISVRQLKMFLDQNEKIPFPALKYLIAECNYGGRVTDDKDRRLIVTLLDDYFNDKVLNDKNYKFGPQDVFKIPKLSTHQQYLDHIQTLPHLIHPNVFGFHSNADITKDINQTNLLLESVLLCSAESGDGKGQSLEELLERLIQSILGDFPEAFDVNEIMKLYPVSYNESMNTVLTQELQRFNGLIKIVRSSLKDLRLALMGKIVMNAPLQAASKALFNGKVPDLWMGKSYPSLKPLGSYVADLKARLTFFQRWIDVGNPVVFWISGFFFTQSFLTGVLQNYARKYTIPIDEITYDFEFIKENPDLKPEDGAYVNGLFLEGCRWNYDTMRLDESEPKILFTKCPHILLKPSHSSKLSNYKNYKCPVYKTSARRGVLSTTGHSTNFVMFMRLPTELQQSHWIKRGVALLTQLDE